MSTVSRGFVAWSRDTDDTKQRYRDIRAIPAVLRVGLVEKGHAMTKTISIYAVQILLGVIAIAFGYAKLTGAGLMVQQFQAIGLGQGFLTVAGIAEIFAGIASAIACNLSVRNGPAQGGGKRSSKLALIR